MAERGTITLDLSEIERDDVDAIIHHSACYKLRLMEHCRPEWICADTCPVRERAILSATPAELDDLRAAMEASDGE
jgi:hypothetical protein